MLKISRSTESTIRPRKGGVRDGIDSNNDGGDDGDYDDKHSP